MTQLEPQSDYGTFIFDSETGDLLLRFDLNTNEDYSLEADITEFPVEAGFSVSDHHVSKLRKFDITAIITNTPIDGDTTPQRALRAYEIIDDLCFTGRVLTITSGLRVWQNMQIKSYKIPRDYRTAQQVNVKLSFVEIRYVESESIDVPPEILSALRRASAKSKSNKKDEPKPPTEQQANGRRKTLAKQLRQAGSALLSGAE